MKMKATNSIFLLFAMFFSVLNFAQKAKNYKGFYDDKAINIVLKSNNDGTLEGYLFYTKNSKSKFKKFPKEYNYYEDAKEQCGKIKSQKEITCYFKGFKMNELEKLV